MEAERVVALADLVLWVVEPQKYADASLHDRYLQPLNKWAAEHGTKFRSQTYGIPPVTMSSQRFVDLPEGEGTQWRRFSTTRWATSANHIYGRPVTSSETWTWLHSPVFRANPLDNIRNTRAIDSVWIAGGKLADVTPVTNTN